MSFGVSFGLVSGRTDAFVGGMLQAVHFEGGGDGTHADVYEFLHGEGRRRW